MKTIKRIGKKYFIRKFKACGQNPRFNPLNSYIEYNKISLGDNVFINSNAYIAGEISIGNDVLIGPNVTIVDGSGYHNYKKVGLSIREQGRGVDSHIVLEDDCWIAANVVILSGAKIGMGAVVGAGAVVTKAIPPFTIALGNPCKSIKYRYSDSELITHLTTKGWSKDDAIKIVHLRKKEFELMRSLTDDR